MRNALAASLILSLLGGCTTISALGQASQALDVYELRAPDLPSAPSRRSSIELVVAEPVASGSINTDRILIRPTPLQAQYLPDARWADTAPVMLQTLMLRSISGTDAFRTVGRQPLAAIADVVVLAELTEFEAQVDEARADPAVVRVRLMVRLVRESDTRVLASRTFGATARAASVETEAVVAAFDEATADLLAELVPWLVERA